MALAARLYCFPMRAFIRVALASIASAVALGMLLSIHPVHGMSPHDRHLTSVRHGISIEAPAGWTLSQHTGYGDTVVVLLHPDGSRISVTAAPTNVIDAQALLEQNRKGLVAQKLVLSDPKPGPRGFITLDLSAPSRPDRLRQLYLVRPTPGGHQAVVLTLVGRTSSFADHTAALDFVVNRLGLDDPERTSVPAKDSGTPPARSASSSNAPARNVGGSGGQVPPGER